MRIIFVLVWLCVLASMSRGEDGWVLQDEGDLGGAQVHVKLSGDAPAASAVIAVQVRIAVEQGKTCQVLRPSPQSVDLTLFPRDSGLVEIGGRTELKLKGPESKNISAANLTAMRDVYEGKVRLEVSKDAPPGLYNVRFDFISEPQTRTQSGQTYFILSIPVGPFNKSVSVQIENSRIPISLSQEGNFKLTFQSNVNSLRFRIKDFSTSDIPLLGKVTTREFPENGVLVGGSNSGDIPLKAVANWWAFLAPNSDEPIDVRYRASAEVLSPGNDLIMATTPLDNAFKLSYRLRPDGLYFFVALFVSISFAVLGSLIRNYLEFRTKRLEQLKAKEVPGDKFWVGLDWFYVLIIPGLFGAVLWLISFVSDARVTFHNTTWVTHSTLIGSMLGGLFAGLVTPENQIKRMIELLSGAKPST